MKPNQNSQISFSGRVIAKNTVFNLLGYGIPLAFAIVLIPILIKGLGQERFGILNLVWIIIGYFSFFDLGIGRAITKIIAEKIGTNKTEDIPGIFWTSFFLMLSVSVLSSIVLFFLSPVFAFKIFNISEALLPETLQTFKLLALSIPIVTTTAGLRGVLEAYQRFDKINVIRVILGISSFLGPVLCLLFTVNLVWIVIFLVIIRMAVWFVYLFQCFELNSNLKYKRNFSLDLVRSIFKLSGWMTISNIIVPVFVYFDKFLIGAMISAVAIAYYATPYEIISKLLTIPGALTGVLFPTFSASYQNNPEFTKKISLKAVKYIFIIFFPVVLVIVTFAYEGLNLWLGVEFAINSTFILQLLAIGILFLSMAYIPYTFLEGIGRPDITAKVQLTELPFYVIFMWLAIKEEGINGAALVWLSRVVLDAFILFYLAKRKFPGSFEFSIKSKHGLILVLLLFSFLPVFISSVIVKIFVVLFILLIYSFIIWKFLLQDEEKKLLISFLRASG